MCAIYDFLGSNSIQYERHDHPPVFTCEEADRLVPPLPAAKTKNLFLRDRKGRRHFLVVVDTGKQVDLRALPKLLECSKLSMGSADRLEQHLGIEPGSVSMLALLNDTEGKVETVIDRDLWESAAFQCHPLVNTSTLVISREGIERFLDRTGHHPRIVLVPGE